MTVTSNDRRIEYAGNGVATVFAGPKVFDAEHIAVYLIDDGTGVEVALSSSTDYAVSGTGLAASRVTMAVPPPTDYTLAIERTVPLTQTVRFTNQGAFYAEIHEEAFDRVVMMIQQLDEDIFDLPDPEALRPLVWSAVNPGTLENGDTSLTGDMLLRGNLSAVGDGYGGELVAFLQSGTGTVTRTTQSKNEESVNLLDYIPPNLHAAILAGTNTTSLSPYVQAAFDDVIQTGRVLELPPAEILLDSRDSSFEGGFGPIYLNFTADGQSLRVKGAGRGLTSFKEVDGSVFVGGRFTKMFYMYLNATSVQIDTVSFTDLTFNKNGAANGAVLDDPKNTAANFYFWEQAHCFQCIATSTATGAHVKSFEFERIEIKDKVGAGINFAMLCPVDHIKIDDVIESEFDETLYGERGDLELTAFCDDYRISNVVLRYAQTEPESGYEATATYPRTYYFSNSKIDVLQLQEPAAASWYARLYVSNCYFPTEFSTQGLMTHAVNSTCALTREIYARRGKFSNCTILMGYDSGTNACDSVYVYNGNSDSNYRQEWLFDNCDFVLDTDDQGVLATGYQVNASTAAKTTARNMKILRFNQCTFDARVQFVCTTFEIGDGYFDSCKIRCWGAEAFTTGAASSNTGFLSLRNNDYSELPAATNIVRLVRSNELWGFEWDERLSLTTYRMNSTGGATFAGYTIHPEIQSTARPTTTTKLFTVGDVTRNIAPSAASPVTEWVCTVAGNPGTHVATKWLTTKGTTANRPTLHAGDVGVTYLDTTLHADGWPISWNGTKWVSEVIAASATVNWPSLAAGAEQTTPITVTGAVLGDLVEAVSISVDLAGTKLTGYVSAADTVTLIHRNDTGGAVDLASASVRVRVRKA